jgi:uncharacterized protein (TIGR00369 family)
MSNKNILELYNQMNEFGKDHDMKFTVISPGKIEYSFTPQQRHLATTHAIHGGMLAAYMDAIIGVAALSAVHHEGKYVATIEFKINFLSPAYSGNELIGHGNVITNGKSTLVVSGNIIDNQGNLIATGLGTLKSYLPKL